MEKAAEADYSRKTIIKINNMSKKYGRKTILSHLHLEIHQGDSIAFIGHNGCGKSTLLKIIGGLQPFNDGHVTYTKKMKFSYVPERFPAMNISALDYVRQMGAIAGLSPQEAEKRSMQLFESFFMQDMAETPIRYLSKGTIQKVAVVQAFLTAPDVLLLDEPVSGQDAASQRVFVRMVNRLNAEQDVTILCACHEDYLISSIAHAVYEIKAGKLQQVDVAAKPAGHKRILYSRRKYF